MKKLITNAYAFIVTSLAVLGTSEAFAQNGNTAGTSFTNNTTSAQGVNIKGAGVLNTGEGGGLVAAIKTVINWALGMLALVALIVLLRGGRQMVSAAGDEGQYKKGFVILKQAAFGLIFIGVAWLMVSGIFFFINIVTA